MDYRDNEKEIEYIRIRRPKNRNSAMRAVIALAIFMGFLIGLVLGMLIIHYKSRQEIQAVQDELDEVIREQSAINVTNVYIPERKLTEGKIAMNPYKTENFRIDEGFMAYFDDEGNKISHLGADLSYHNDKVDWDELKAAGCEFVMLRCGYRGYTEGGLLADEKFSEYIDAAQAAGINVGVYFFTQAITVDEAVEEADFVAELLDGRSLQYPVALDTEYVNDEAARSNTAGLTRQEKSECCIAFCERIREYGYYPMIYASENWLRRDLDLYMLRDYDLWAPHYRDENDFLYDFTMWQYTEEGEIPGVKGLVDLDISLVDYEKYIPAMQDAYETGKIEATTSNGVITITKSN